MRLYDKIDCTEHRAGARAVDLGGPSVITGGGDSSKFDKAAAVFTKHKNRCLQKRKLVNWGGQACRLGGPGPSLAHLGAGSD